MLKQDLLNFSYMGPLTGHLCFALPAILVEERLSTEHPDFMQLVSELKYFVLEKSCRLAVVTGAVNESFERVSPMALWCAFLSS